MNRAITAITVATALLFSAGQAQAVTTVAGANGVNLAVFETGNPDGPPVVFVHGFTMNHLAWEAQYNGPLAEEYRIIALDLRGHGASDKPLKPEHYGDYSIWADDINAVIRAKELDQPVLVGWSMAGALLASYLAEYGDDDISGVAFTGAFTSRTTSEGESVFEEQLLPHIQNMAARDPRTSIEATRAFVGMLTANELDPDAFSTLFASSMMVPPEVRGAIVTMELGIPGEALADITAPMLVIHGTDDAMIKPAAAEHIAETFPNAELHLYEGIGHTPQMEAPERFNSDVKSFLRAAFADTPQ
ncbi:alpha/beta hydrolase [Aquisalimonas sp.]|uniref:alpha/beta fold hydrolase n=1 Tax=unclassified Aquisalimonas TaxID=2644645 RepID=UPI0025BF668C|nr:alpha/beta hydrolase [Aquisalimonas sp.]